MIGRFGLAFPIVVLFSGAGCPVVRQGGSYAGLYDPRPSCRQAAVSAACPARSVDYVPDCCVPAPWAWCATPAAPPRGGPLCGLCGWGPLATLAGPARKPLPLATAYRLRGFATTPIRSRPLRRHSHPASRRVLSASDAAAAWTWASPAPALRHRRQVRAPDTPWNNPSSGRSSTPAGTPRSC